MSSSKHTDGAIVFASKRGINNVSAEEAQNLAQQHGIDVNTVPKYLGHQTSFDRAIERATGLKRQGILLRPLSRNTTGTTKGVIFEEKIGENKLDHGQISRICWREVGDPPRPEVVQFYHTENEKLRSVAKEVYGIISSKYTELEGRLTATDWTDAIRSYLRDVCCGAKIGDGIYWIPPSSLTTVQAYQAFLLDVGIKLSINVIEANDETGVNKQVAAEAASASLADDLAKLEEAVLKLTEKSNASVMGNRIAEAEQLRRRALLYRDSLGIAVEQAERALETIEEETSEMLETRKTRKLDKATGELVPAPVRFSPQGEVMQGLLEIGIWQGESGDYTVTLKNGRVVLGETLSTLRGDIIDAMQLSPAADEPEPEPEVVTPEPEVAVVVEPEPEPAPKPVVEAATEPEPTPEPEPVVTGFPKLSICKSRFPAGNGVEDVDAAYGPLSEAIEDSIGDIVAGSLDSRLAVVGEIRIALDLDGMLLVRGTAEGLIRSADALAELYIEIVK